MSEVVKESRQVIRRRLFKKAFDAAARMSSTEPHFFLNDEKTDLIQHHEYRHQRRNYSTAIAAGAWHRYVIKERLERNEQN